MNKHIALGIVIAIVVQLMLLAGFDFVAGSQNRFNGTFLFLALQSSTISLLSIAAGAYVARSGFFPSAIAIWLVEWLAIIYILVLIDDGRHDQFAVALTVAKLNWLGIISSLLFTFVGVKLGHLARAKFSAAPATI